MAQLESILEHRLGAALKELGALYYKWVSPGNIGVPDRIAILPGGKVLFLELKQSGGALSPVQKVQLAKLKEQGCTVRVVRGWPDAERLLRDVKYGLL